MSIPLRAQPRAAAGSSSLYAWFVVAVLALANCVSFIDRLLLSLLVQPLKAELALSDTQVSLLQGAAFAIFYASMGLVIARWADRASRKWIVTVGIMLWCLMTAASGTARAYWELFLYRIGVGVGEATLSPSAYSLIAGYFPRERLALAVGVFSAGVTGGMGLAYLVGGAVIGWVGSLGTLEWPAFGALSGWRLVFALIGLLGLPVALLMLLVREPPRTPGFVPARIGEVWAHFRANLAAYGLVFAGYGATSITVFAVIYWTPTFYQRTFGATIPEAATALGITALAGGLLGAFTGGAFADRLERRGDARAKLRVLFWCGLGLVPPGILSPLMPDMTSAVAVLFFTFFFGTAATGPAGAFVQSITPDRMRAQFGAAYQFALTLAGATLGPTAVALFTDYVFADESALRYSLVCVAALANPLAAWLLWRAFRSAASR